MSSLQHHSAQASGASTHGLSGSLSGELAAMLEAAWIPSPPEVLLRVISLSESDAAALAELATVISRDPGLSARILSLANSPALRRGRELRRIDDCIAVLGTRFVRTIAACFAVQAVFDDAARQVECDLSGFWLHSLEVAELARAIALASAPGGAEEAYLAGLLHDTGELLLLTGAPNYSGLLQTAGDEATLCALELQVFETHHGVVGSWLIDQWGIDSFLADAVLFHHQPRAQIAFGDELTRVLWVAHAVSTVSEQLPDDVAELVDLDADSLASLRAEARQRAASIALAMGITADVSAEPLPVPRNLAALPAATPLGEAAQSMAYAQPVQESLFAVSGDDELLLTVRESARILFGLARTGLLLCDHERGVLSGERIGNQSALLRRLEIPLAAVPSLTVRAVLEGKPLCSLEDGCGTLGVGDIQILRALGGEALLCVPLCVRQQCSGVMLFGLNAPQWLRVSRRLHGLSHFSRVVAAGIEAAREAKVREQATEAAVASRYRLRARQVAHEAGNPLTIIRNYLKLLERRLASEEQVPRELSFLDEEIARVGSILQDIGDVGSASTEVPYCDVAELIGELLAGYGETLFAANGIELSLDLPSAGARVAAARDPLIQVLLNLWKNAAEAMPGGGSYHIEVVAGVREGRQTLVELRLQDSGPGLPAEIWARIADGQGAASADGPRGLGLGIVLERVTSMSGRIICATPPGRGSLFAIYLPAAEV
ncbi:HDOD domain-containing protein [Rhodocyclus tenuis]|uniref:HDOD domain-containing protein n=1 Tax=Rhodocyclus tenuis TaxID=1066 RepID=UPI0019048F63|nr:HDOD domain-containing protein [Rhodocyclus tenuis]MBK1678925.1 hypothetical protein [Rhodocyclus tenuis]